MLLPWRNRLLRLGERWLGSPSSLCLLPLSWIFHWVAWARNQCYDRGWLPVTRVSVPVVSIGNLALGGRGKTPLVILVATQFPKTRLAILARGYGAKGGGLNDEMEVIRRHLPSARLYQGKDRVSLARRAVAEGAELLILDDGFQHRRLHRDWDWVVVRPEDLKGRCPPCGELRESPRGLARADAIFSYQEMAGAVPIQVISCISTSIAKKRVSIFCGIGHPERFRKTVESLGAEVVGELFVGDHQPISIEDLETFYNRTKPLYLVCTEKDWVKLPPHSLPILFVRIEGEVVGESVVWDSLIAKIKEKLHH